MEGLKHTPSQTVGPYYAMRLARPGENVLPAGEARGLFRVTAVLLLITETFGAVVPVLLRYRKQTL